MILPRPTMRGKIMLCAAGIALAAALVNPGVTLCMMSAGFISIVLGSFFMAFLSLHKINLIRGPMHDGSAASVMNMPVMVHNLSNKVRQSMVISEKCPFLPEKIINTPVSPLMPGEKRFVNRSIVPLLRGYYYLDKISLIGGDPAGLFRRVKNFKQVSDVIIFPETVKLSWMPIGDRRQTISALAGRPLGVAGLGYDFFGVREYRPSDGVRFIHWKSTARYHKLMVKEFEATSVTNVIILLDPDKTHAGTDEQNSNFEFLVKTAASIVNYISGNFCRISLLSSSGSDGLIRISGEGAAVRDKIMHALATIRVSETNIDMLIEEHPEIFQANSIFYCLSMSGSLNTSKKLELLIDRHLDVRWIYAPNEYFPAIQPLFFKRKKFGIDDFKNFEGSITPFVARREMDISGILTYE